MTQVCYDTGHWDRFVMTFIVTTQVCGDTGSLWTQVCYDTRLLWQLLLRHRFVVTHVCCDSYCYTQLCCDTCLLWQLLLRHRFVVTHVCCDSYCYDTGLWWHRFLMDTGLLWHTKFFVTLVTTLDLVWHNNVETGLLWQVCYDTAMLWHRLVVIQACCDTSLLQYSCYFARLQSSRVDSVSRFARHWGERSRCRGENERCLCYWPLLTPHRQCWGPRAVSADAKAPIHAPFRRYGWGEPLNLSVPTTARHIPNVGWTEIASRWVAVLTEAEESPKVTRGGNFFSGGTVEYVDLPLALTPLFRLHRVAIDDFRK